MITVVCVEWGNYLGRAQEYIDKLRAAVARNLLSRHEFVALRLDEPGDRSRITDHGSRFTGWFQKLEIFRPGLFAGRVMYLDLDSVIVGGLDPLIYRKGAVHLKDWGWLRNVHAGGLLVWDAELEGRRIWEAWDDSVPERFDNDQEWLTSLNVWEPLPADLVRSYRYHCSQGGPPPGARVIAFHGNPKPHQVSTRWVREAWRI